MSSNPWNPSVRQEEDRVPTAGIVAVLILVLAVMSLGALGAWALLRVRETQYRPYVLHQPARIETAPAQISGVEQTLIEEDTTTATLHARTLRELQSYGWLDREHGVAHIPVEAAMRRVAREGW